MKGFIGDSISDLIGNLKESIKTFVGEEVELAKKEISEKISACVQNGVTLMVGGFVAYAGLIVFPGGIGLVIGFGFEKLGLDTALAVFAGLAIAGLLAGGGGGLMLLQGVKAIAATPPVPEKTIDAVMHATGVNGHPTSKPQPMKDPRSPDELHESAKGTAGRLEDEKEELLFQLTPRQLKERAVRHMKEHPLMWGAAALGGSGRRSERRGGRRIAPANIFEARHNSNRQAAETPHLRFKSGPRLSPHPQCRSTSLIYHSHADQLARPVDVWYPILRRAVPGPAVFSHTISCASVTRRPIACSTV